MSAQAQMIASSTTRDDPWLIDTARGVDVLHEQDHAAEQALELGVVAQVAVADDPQFAARRQGAGDALGIRFGAARVEHHGRRIGPDQIRTAATDPEFLAGVLDYFLSDEPLLIAFAKSEDINPAEIQRARIALGGVWERDLP